MTLTELIKFIWNGVDIPVTKDEIQHCVNVSTWAIKEDLSHDEDICALNDEFNKRMSQNKLYHINNN